MSTVSYKKICTIKITHEYFNASLAEGVSLSLGWITEQIKNRFDIQIQTMQDSLNIFINSEFATEAFLKSIESVTTNNYFDFNMVISDSDFYNYTNIPFGFIPSYLYASNAIENKSNPNTVELIPKPSAENSNDKFATIKIYFQDIIEASSERQEFLIALTARATFWQYHIINRNLSNPSIQGNVDVSFGAPKQVVLKNGQQAISFTANKPLKLSQTPKYTFDLIDVKEENNQVITKEIFSGLPNASPQNLEISIEHGNQKLLSQIYIYI
ncbi:hypothetical protein Q4512_00245 [Oceanihabitans sp. 2_MG-2023]|uniref:hypothetical protein n=1 Tax=Oceanihabitans sp. 2_MG-2023 TaxID=3062661 RepID=UPI0026E291BB|nr:hypothetical protein [Oceanihabitans sp. 2_MG-2023]MDO6595320.1 hypothetical protein [Oceanihabitans sp. 2_MG-2023]